MKNFAIVGVGGYIAPRHLEAIQKNGGRLIAALDPNDSVGILDRYSPDAKFFTDQGRFQKYLESLKKSESEVQYLSICSPNFLHSKHIELGLSLGAHVICEKPLALSVAELDRLKKLESDSQKKVSVILQLRLHPKIIEIRNAYSNSSNQYIELTYITSRGPWYFESWKGNETKSGGLSTNIGIHFFDMLAWTWGPYKTLNVTSKSPTREEGTLTLERAKVKWMLSISSNDLPEGIKERKQSTFRSIKVENTELEFSEGFSDLHNLSYEKIIEGNGFGIDDVYQATKIVEEIRKVKR